MHPLIPDHFDFRRAGKDEQTLGATEFGELTGPAGADILRHNALADLVYTFATMNPGLVTLHNFPKYLQTFKRPDNGELMDLAATDILRCRELGVPRYTEFRAGAALHVLKNSTNAFAIWSRNGTSVVVAGPRWASRSRLKIHGTGPWYDSRRSSRTPLIISAEAAGQGGSGQIQQR